MKQIGVIYALLLLPLVAMSDELPASATSTHEQAAPTHGKTLFDRLGGKKAVNSVVDDFINTLIADVRVNANPKINEARKRADAKALKRKVATMICEVTGGPCKYDGKAMKEAHAKMGITETDWNFMVEDFTKALTKFKVPAKEQNELLAIVSTTKTDIVTRN